MLTVNTHFPRWLDAANKLGAIFTQHSQRAGAHPLRVVSAKCSAQKFHRIFTARDLENFAIRDRTEELVDRQSKGTRT
jgi:hypothetical protein